MFPKNIIVAFAKQFVIGNNNSLPWHIPQDLTRFSQLTKNGIIVMGYKTYMSIPQERMPLPGRINVVIIRGTFSSINKKGVYFVTENDVDSILTNLYEETHKQVWIIGGHNLYKRYMGDAEKIYATVIEKQFEGDVKFPLNNFDRYEIDSYEKAAWSQEYNCSYRFITYKQRKFAHTEFAYINLIKDVLANGVERPDRTGVGTKSVFSRQIRFDISKYVPFVTTKSLAYRSVLKELLFFLQGKTNSKCLEEQGVNIWKDNTTREFLDKRGLQHYEEGDMGPMYFFQIYHFGAKYEGCNTSYEGKGFNQLEELLQNLRVDPFSRRHLLTTYNPEAVSESVLAPCHGISIMFYVDEENGVKQLSCHVLIRSSDVALGLPFNIASYAIFTYIIAKKVDMSPKELVITTGDTHIYKNLYDGMNLQVDRTPLPEPVLIVNDRVKMKRFEDICIEDFEVVGYLNHPTIKMQMAV